MGRRRRSCQILKPKSQAPTPKSWDWDFLGTWDLVIGIWDFLARPPPARYRLQTNTAADRGCDDAQFRHQALELRRVHRLRAVAQRVIGIVVDFDDETV